MSYQKTMRGFFRIISSFRHTAVRAAVWLLCFRNFHTTGKADTVIFMDDFLWEMKKNG